MMDSKTLKAYILNNDKLELILDEIGMHSIINHGSYVTCGFPNGDNPVALTVRLTEYLSITSYTRNIQNPKGFATDLVDLVCFVKELEPYPALVFMMEKCGLSVKVGKNSTPTVDDGLDVFRKHKRKLNKAKESHVFGMDILNKFSSILPICIIKDDWIMPNMWDKYHLKFDEQSDRILFPHFAPGDKETILAVVGRTVKKGYKELKIPKYLTVIGKGYNKASNLYGLSLNREHIERERKVILFEGEKSVIKADQIGYPIGVSVGCHSISKEQIKLLLSLNVDEIIISFDNDVDLSEIEQEINILKNFRKVSVIKDEWKLLGEKDSPVDKGMKRFKFLYKNRKAL